MPALAADDGDLQRAAAAAMRVAGMLSARGWAEGSAGNITVRLAAAPPADRLPVVTTHPLEEHVPGISGAVFLSSATGTRMRDIAEGRGLCVVRVSPDGSSLEVRAAEGEPGLAPTSEFPSHLRIHENLGMTGRPERAVVHTHPTELIALTHVLRENDGADPSRVLYYTPSESPRRAQISRERAPQAPAAAGGEEGEDLPPPLDRQRGRARHLGLRACPRCGPCTPR